MLCLQDKAREKAVLFCSMPFCTLSCSLLISKAPAQLRFQVSPQLPAALDISTRRLWCHPGLPLACSKPGSAARELLWGLQACWGELLHCLTSGLGGSVWMGCLDARTQREHAPCHIIWALAVGLALQTGQELSAPPALEQRCFKSDVTWLDPECRQDPTAGPSTDPAAHQGVDMSHSLCSEQAEMVQVQ